MSCKKCKEVLIDEDSLECSKCALGLHYFCAGIGEKQFRSMLQMNKAKWKCLECRPKAGGASDDLWEKLVNYLGEKLDPVTQFIKGDLARDLSSIKEKLTQIEEIRNSIQFLSDEYDRMNGQLKATEAEMAKIKSSNEMLADKNRQLEQRLNLLEQRQRKNNIELQNVPEKRGENLLSIAKRIGEVVGFPIKDEEVLASHRVQGLRSGSGLTNRPRNIVVELQSSSTRDRLLRSVKTFNRGKTEAKQKLNSAQLGVESGDPVPVFVAEHLSPYYKDLHARVRFAAREKKIKFVWIQGGRILTRRDEKSPIIEIRDLDCIHKL